VDYDPVSGDVFQYPFISRWRAALVMFRGEAVDRHDQVQIANQAPLRGNWPHRAGDKLHLDSHPVEPGKQITEFAIAHQRLTSDNRKMNRPHALYELEDRVDEFLAAIIGQVAEYSQGAKMVRSVRVAPGTAKRTFFGDLNRKEWSPAPQYAPPHSQNVGFLHAQPMVNSFEAASEKRDEGKS
jgi:hypothetical protein